MRKNSGFTLLELMVVIGIVAILAAVTVPNLIAWLPKYRVGSAARNVKSAVEFARMQAIRENADVNVNFDFANDRITVVNAAAVTLRRVQWPPEIDLIDGTAPTGLGVLLQFDGRGFADTSGTVSVGNTMDASLGRNISVTLGGNARIQ